MRIVLAAFALAVLAGSGAGAQSPAPDAGPAASPASRPVVRAHRDVSTADPNAQAAFDHGLTLLYAFNPEEARRAFGEAARLDPTLAMAQWGLAMSYGVNINTSFDPGAQAHAREAIGRAHALEPHASPVERALIGAAARRFAYVRANQSATSAKAYRDAMRTVAGEFASDDDVQTLAAEAEMDVHPWSYFTADGRATPGTLEIIGRLHDVLARTPGHIGANHYLIHAFEESPHPEEALPAATRLAALAFEPAAEHLAHMPAHAFMRAGAYGAAGDANARAVALYKTYLAGDPAGHGDYFGHDCVFGVDAYMMAGAYAAARGIALECARNGGNMMPIVDFRFRRWASLANGANASDFLGGMLLAHDGRFALAQEHLRALRNSGDAVGTIQTALLEAALARGAGKSDAEIAALQHAVTVQDGFDYAEPPTFWYPVRETLGGAYFRAQRYADAERTFRDDLARNRENPRSLFGLAETLAREDRGDDERAVRERFARAWRQGDGELDVRNL